MIGPGTGIAPFRGFLHHRAMLGGSGRNWLFHGARRRDQDFLYREEIKGMHDDGVLDRLDVAFSREQEEKVYVQHLMDGHGADLYHWLRDGAVLYVCGDADEMAQSVEDALVGILTAHGDHDDASARARLEELKAEGRYLRDVY